MSIKIAPNVLSSGNIASPSGALTALALNAAYNHLVSGTGFAIRLFSRDLEPITEVYLYATSFTGTKASVTMRCRAYGENPAAVIRPGATLLATSSTTTLPAGASGWIKFEFATPYTPTVLGEIVWLVMDNTAAAPTVNFPNIRSALNAAVPLQSLINNYSTVNGYTANGVSLPRAAAFFVQGGATRGFTMTNIATPVATNTRPRGVVLTPPIDTQIELIEFSSIPGVNMANIKIWDSTQLPNDTPMYEFATGQTGRASSELSGSIFFEPPFIARKNRTYYVCWDFTTNNTNPTCLTVEDHAAIASVADQNMDNFTLLPLVRDDGANNWVIERNFSPRLQLIIGDLLSATITSAS